MSKPNTRTLPRKARRGHNIASQSGETRSKKAGTENSMMKCGKRLVLEDDDPSKPNKRRCLRGSRVTLLTLLDDVQQLIFDRLSNEDLLTLTTVCRALSTVSYSRLFRNFGIAEKRDNFDIDRHSLCVNERNLFAFQKWCQTPGISSVTYLQVSLCSMSWETPMQLLADVVSDLPKKLSKLRQVSFRCSGKIGLKKLYKFIDALALTNCEELTLASVRVTGSPESYGVPFCFENKSRLLRLSLDDVTLNAQELVPLVAYTSSLETLEISYRNKPSTPVADMGQVLSHVNCPISLMEVVLDNAAVSLFDFTSFVRRHPKLNHLRLRQANLLHVLPAPLPSFPLTHLDSFDSTYDVVRTVLEQCTAPPRLSSLKIALAPATTALLAEQLAFISNIGLTVSSMQLTFSPTSIFDAYGSPSPAMLQGTHYLRITSTPSDQVFQADNFVAWFQSFPNIPFLTINNYCFQAPRTSN